MYREGRSYFNIFYIDDIYFFYDYLVCFNNCVGEKEEGFLLVL